MRQDQRRQQVDEVACRMQASGVKLHMRFRWFGRDFYLSDGTHIERETAELLTKDPRIATADDALFADFSGQTWRFNGR